MTMLNYDIKIAYVIGAPFPTMKAYGVTSRETINVLLKNKVRTKVFCLNGQYYDSDYKSILKEISEFKKNIASKLLISLGSMGSTKLNFFCWRVGIAKIISKTCRFSQTK